MCCGESMAEKGGAHFRNPNTCASCSSLSDGMPESSVPSFTDFDDKMPGEVDVHQVTAEAV